jgi:phosphohistidine phosphatase SixA
VKNKSITACCFAAIAGFSIPKAVAVESPVASPNTTSTAVGTAPMLDGSKFDTALGTTLLTTLRQGGHVIYFRHFETGRDTPDTKKARVGDCASQRQLNAAGVAQAISVRDAFQKHAIPISRVYSSPFCRAWLSADIAFGRHKAVENLKLAKSPTPDKVSKKAARQMAKALRPLLIAKPPVGTTSVIVAHDDNLPTVGAPHPETQGEALLFKPTGRKFKLVMQIKPDAWQKLAALDTNAAIVTQ